MLVLRPIRDKDLDVLRLATFYNLNWREERFSMEEIDLNPQFFHYYNNLGNKDFGFIAQRHQQIFGIVWVKYFTEQEPSFGFIGNDIPELSLSVFPEYRNSGFGTKLLKFAIDDARIRMIDSLSLSVESENILVIKLYEKFGFQYVDKTKGVMQVNL